MASRSTSPLFRIGACAVGAVAVAGVVWFAFFRHKTDDTPSVDHSALPFWECANEAGITWQMHFLASEQGEKFKINLYDHGCGLAVGDFDGDGKDDIYFCNQLGPNALYRNKGDGTFEDVAKQARVALGDRVCTSATWVDYANEGRPSLFVTSTRGGNVMFHNNGDGTFTDLTKDLGLEHIGHSQAGVFFDYDNDGYLDLLVTNTAEWTTGIYIKSTRHYLGKGDFDELLQSPREHNILYHNVPVDPKDPEKGRKFVNVSEKSGLAGPGWACDAVVFDYDGDGFVDLFVTNMFGQSQLYHNNQGTGSFTDVTKDVLRRTPYGAVGARLIDFNNDGRLGLYVTDMHSDMWMGLDQTHKSLELAREWEKRKPPTLTGPPPYGPSGAAAIAADKEDWRKHGVREEEVFFGNAFYRNDGKGKFTEISEQAGLENFWPWGSANGDFDNDGHEDVFVTSGMGYPFYYWGNYLLMNQGDGTYRNRAEDLGIEPPQRGKFFPELLGGKQAARSSRCAVAADFRGVGQLDIVTNNFNDQPYYFKNQLPKKNYIQFRLQGSMSHRATDDGIRRSNRDAIGAVVRLYQGDKVMTRQVQGTCGYLAQTSRTLHFGLGDQTTIDRVEITWPSGQRQTIRNPAANQRRDVVEGKAE